VVFTSADDSTEGRTPSLPDRRHFHHAPVVEDRQGRAESVSRKIDIPDRLTGFVKDLLELKRNVVDGANEQWISNLQPALSSVEFASEPCDVLTEFPHRPALVTGAGFHLDSVLRQ
jgi:hypothetical protein